MYQIMLPNYFDVKKYGSDPKYSKVLKKAQKISCIESKVFK